jgi:hypothetical protein
MTIIDAMHELIADPNAAIMDYFDLLRWLTEKTGHMPFGFIWLEVGEGQYGESKGIPVRMFEIEWLPADANMPKQNVITILESLIGLLNEAEETQRGHG